MSARKALYVCAALLCLVLGASAVSQRQRNNALIIAIRQNDANAVRRLLANGADPNARDETGALVSTREVARRIHGTAGPPPTALLVALEERYQGPNEYEGTWTWSPENTEIVRAILDAGADLRASPGGYPPLVLAASAGKAATVKLLLARGADPNQADFLGGTPLVAAIVAERADIVRLLLKHGASVQVQGPQGQSPLSLAQECESEEIAELLRSAGTTR